MLIVSVEVGVGGGMLRWIGWIERRAGCGKLSNVLSQIDTNLGLIPSFTTVLLSKQYIETCSETIGTFDDPDLLELCLFWKAYAPAWSCRDTISPVPAVRSGTPRIYELYRKKFQCICYTTRYRDAFMS